eukprot:1198307-Rhodomonas_salina.1
MSLWSCLASPLPILSVPDSEYRVAACGAVQSQCQCQPGNAGVVKSCPGDDEVKRKVSSCLRNQTVLIKRRCHTQSLKQ